MLQLGMGECECCGELDCACGICSDVEPCDVIGENPNDGPVYFKLTPISWTVATSCPAPCSMLNDPITLRAYPTVVPPDQYLTGMSIGLTELYETPDAVLDDIDIDRPICTSGPAVYEYDGELGEGWDGEGVCPCELSNEWGAFVHYAVTFYYSIATGDLTMYVQILIEQGDNAICQPGVPPFPCSGMLVAYGVLTLTTDDNGKIECDGFSELVSLTEQYRCPDYDDPFDDPDAGPIASDPYCALPDSLRVEISATPW